MCFAFLHIWVRGLAFGKTTRLFQEQWMVMGEWASDGEGAEDDVDEGIGNIVAVARCFECFEFGISRQPRQTVCGYSPAPVSWAWRIQPPAEISMSTKGTIPASTPAAAAEARNPSMFHSVAPAVVYPVAYLSCCRPHDYNGNDCSESSSENSKQKQQRQQ